MYFYNTELGYTVVGAWGLRRLVTGYSGPIVRIRDTTGGAEQDVYADVTTGELNAFTVTGNAAITTVYDQSGNGADIGQATSSLQPLLILNATGNGKPVARFDGVDDLLRDLAAASTSRPYLSATPIHVSLSGPRLPREQWGKVWCIPHQDGSNSSPYSRSVFEQDNASSLYTFGQYRADSTQVGPFTLFGFNNKEGWNAHASIDYLGRFLQAGAPAFEFSADTSVTYPNNTRLYIGANGEGTENNGMDWVEHVIYSTSSPVQANVQALLDKMAYERLIGPNRYYKMLITGSFSGTETDAGIAEMEFRASIGGSDLTTADTPMTANKRYNGTETWECILDNNNSTHYSSGNSPASQPELYFMLPAANVVQEVYMKARGDGFSQYTIKRYKIYRFTESGWQQSVQEIENKNESYSSGQTYTDGIVWPVDTPAESHAYWRIRYGYPDGDNAQLSELYFLDAAGTDLCTGGTVIYSSQYDSGTPYFGAANAFDRNTTTGYAANGYVSQWLGYHFASPVAVDKVRWVASNLYPSLAPKTICVDYSDDGSNWYPYDHWRDTGGAMSSVEVRERKLIPHPITTEPVAAHRYWRVRPVGSRSNAQIIARIIFYDASNADTTTTEGGSPIESDHESTWFNTFPFARTYSYGWQSQLSIEQNLNSWVGWDYGAGNEQEIVKVLLGSYSQTTMPIAYYIEYSDDNVTWTIRDKFVTPAWASGSYQEQSFIFPDIVPDGVSGTYGFSYMIEEGEEISGTYGFSYEIDNAAITTTYGFSYDIEGPLVATFGFSYAIELRNLYGFRYKIEAEEGDLLGYRHVAPATVSRTFRTFQTEMTGRVIDTVEIITDAEPHYHESVSLPSVASAIHDSFYGDYYDRIWVDPEDLRLSNPKIGFHYSFGVWNAYDRPNDMIDYIGTDVDGVEFVEEINLPITFGAIEYRIMHFLINEDAPSQIDGDLFFQFTNGGDGFHLFALVLGILKTLPNEPFTEVWSWSTTMEVSRDGTEQRMGLRDQPRTRAAYNVMILDEEDRQLAYQQLYSFATRSVIVPLMQYTVKLDADASLGDTRLYFDLSQSDIRADEYLVVFNPHTSQFQLVQVSTLNSDGVNLVTPLTFDIEAEIWDIVPGRSMRLPNRSSLGFGAVNGAMQFRGESTEWRDLMRPGSSVVLPTYDDIPVLPYKPIAQNDINETFYSDVAVIDNESNLPLQRSTFTNPFVESTKAWQIDREEEMDWWRTFFDHTAGMLRPFLLPTWRNDLPLVEQPEVGDNELVTSATDFTDYYAHNTYQWVQIQSDAGVIYRRIESVETVENGLRLSLDETIGFTAGSNENMIVSFLNLTRLNNDDVQLNHFVNWTIVSLDLRTVNQ